MTVTMKAWFRALTAAFKSPAPAQTVAGMSILVLTLYTGYTIPQPSMIGALKWITYINVSPHSSLSLSLSLMFPSFFLDQLTFFFRLNIKPLKYGFEALLVNEMHTINAQCATLIPQGPGYDGMIGIANQVCTTVGSQPGSATVSGSTYVDLSYGYTYSHLWRVSGLFYLCVSFGDADCEMHRTWASCSRSGSRSSRRTGC